MVLLLVSFIRPQEKQKLGSLILCRQRISGLNLTLLYFAINFEKYMDWNNLNSWHIQKQVHHHLRIKMIPSPGISRRTTTGMQTQEVSQITSFQDMHWCHCKSWAEWRISQRGSDIQDWKAILEGTRAPSNRRNCLTIKNGGSSRLNQCRRRYPECYFDFIPKSNNNNQQRNHVS